ncbi:hypothetical protein QFZ24_003247 [Streptomyces phaeochromogenes]|uniref:hypothetical protein n=1 Tax=Streptomyces phaeochromogenes TaxID=1923 RepID=UPI0027943A06|nr:hypothetical protein [Streptomyces phaeochromogenes]MDQ0949324.1 hypothetical protein [Streptomyces phaeochromogenes]
MQDPPEGKSSRWVNTLSTALTAAIAIPALVLSVITYTDGKSDEQENEIKEAAQISWFWEEDGDDIPFELVLENRSLRPVYDAVLYLEDENGANKLTFYFDGTNSPCTRTVYELKEHGKEMNAYVTYLTRELYFRDTLDNWWRTGYTGGLSKDREINVDRALNDDLLEKWGIEPRYEDLAGCG